MDERFKANTETMRNAVTSNEVVKICSSLTRVIGSHIKSAKAVADMEHVKYLESRLTRLEEIKVECPAKFEEEKNNEYQNYRFSNRNEKTTGVSRRW